MEIKILKMSSLAFFQEFFQGGKIYCYANFFYYANFSIAFGPNFREGQKSPRGGGQKSPREGKLQMSTMEECQVAGFHQTAS